MARMSKAEIEAYELAEILSCDRPLLLIVVGRVEGEWRVMWQGWKTVMVPRYYFKGGRCIGNSQ